MQTPVLIISIIIISLCAFLWGVYFYKDHVFPYALAKSVITHFFPRRNFSTPEIEQKTLMLSTFKRKTEVVMIGDSLTDFAEWNDIFPGVSIANHGISGDTVHGIAARIDAILAVGAKKAFIMAGINDIAKGRKVADIIADYSTIIKKLTEHGVQVYIQSTISFNAKLAGYSFGYGDNLAKITEINAHLAQLAQQYKLVFIDLNAKLANNGELSALYTHDGVHLNAAGYKIWKNELEMFLTQP